jgi:hypothetical protein
MGANRPSGLNRATANLNNCDVSYGHTVPATPGQATVKRMCQSAH